MAPRPAARGACALAAAAAIALSPLASASTPTVRLWDEFRVSEVDPNKLTTFSTIQEASVGYTGMIKRLFMHKDWMQIDGISADFYTSDFQFQTLEYPHEWYARLLPQSPLALSVRMRVGKTCECTLNGVAVYKKALASIWLRLQFTDCNGCESTAKRAAVEIQLEPDKVADSNVFAWLCAVHDHEACHPVTTPTTTAAPTTTLEPTTTSSTAPKPCEMGGLIGVQTHMQALGRGRCLLLEGGRVENLTDHSANACQAQCELTYTIEATKYEDHSDPGVIGQINESPKVCKAFAFNEAIKICQLYIGAAVKNATDNSDGWSCTADVSAVKFVQSGNADDCRTTTPVTTTTITTTTKTTTTTTTKRVEKMSFRDLFTSSRANGKCYGQTTDCQVHFPVDKLEATLLQMQSRCYADIDFYVLSRSLPVSEETWVHVATLLADYGDLEAWQHDAACGAHDVERCAASVTIDRLPVEVSFGSAVLGKPHSAAIQSIVIPLFLSVLFSMMAMCIRDMWCPDSNCFVRWIQVPIVFIVAALVMFFSGEFVAFMLRRAAVKVSAWGWNWYCAAEVVSDFCFPMAIAFAIVAAVMYIPDRHRQPEPEQEEVATHLRVQYDPTRRTMMVVNSATNLPVSQSRMSYT